MIEYKNSNRRKYTATFAASFYETGQKPVTNPPSRR